MNEREYQAGDQAQNTELTERRSAILKVVVEEFMATARPVGSGLIAEKSRIKVSTATIRKELGALEEEGFLHQPHTSAGRVPTAQGYRYFVDTLMAPSELGAVDNRKIVDFFDHSHGELERILTDTSKLLAGVTNSAAVVVAPRADVARVRSIQLVRLAENDLLVVVVLSNGGIERRSIELDSVVSDRQIEQAQQLLIGTLDNQHLDVEAAYSCTSTGDPIVDELTEACLESLSVNSPSERRVHIGGRSAVAGTFEQNEKVAEVLQLLERQLIVVTLIRDVLDRGLRVAIGNETGVHTLSDCSLVVAPYLVDGCEAGSIGVLGPTHMNYPQALAAVAAVSDHLGERIARG